jgi:hypothetical protein
MFLKNRRHGLKLLIEASVARPNNCAKKHWENMKHFIASDAKQGEVAKNHAMRAHVKTPSHSCHGGKVGTISKFVSSYLHYPCHIFSTCVIMLVAMW